VVAGYTHVSAQVVNSSLADAIANFSPEAEGWLPLDRLFEEAFSSPNPSAYYPAIFSVFERYPNDDGAGVFWSALHGMEQVGNYEKELLSHFRRWPAALMLQTMLIRMRNAGYAKIEGVEIDLLLGPKSEPNPR
jgi:hypothetical protein